MVSELAPPDVLKTKGVNVAFSTYNTLSSYLYFVWLFHVNSSKWWLRLSCSMVHLD